MVHDCGDMGKLEHQARCQGATRRLGPRVGNELAVQLGRLVGVL